MTVGVISDVHANVVALEAVLASLSRAGAEKVYCLGDLVGYGPAPNESIELLRSASVLCTLGTSDERVAFGFKGSDPPRSGVADLTLEWARGQLSHHNLEFIRALPRQRRVDTPAGRVRFSHDHPESPGERLDVTGDSQRLGAVLKRTRTRLLAVGGSHVPYCRELPEGILLNPGSVGLSLNGEPGADYAVIRETGGAFEVRVAKAGYDVARVSRDIRARGLPTVVARAVEMGQKPEGDFTA